MNNSCLQIVNNWPSIHEGGKITQTFFPPRLVRGHVAGLGITDKVCTTSIFMDTQVNRRREVTHLGINGGARSSWAIFLFLTLPTLMNNLLFLLFLWSWSYYYTHSWGILHRGFYYYYFFFLIKHIDIYIYIFFLLLLIFFFLTIH